MSSRLIALVEHPAREGDSTVEVVTRRRIGAKEPGGRRARTAEKTPGLFDPSAADPDGAVDPDAEAAAEG
jgi:hypothetical protein